MNLLSMVTAVFRTLKPVPVQVLKAQAKRQRRAVRNLE